MAGLLLKIKVAAIFAGQIIALMKEKEVAVNKYSKRRGQSRQNQLMLPLRGLAREPLWDTVVILGLASSSMNWRPIP
jgi:hypothetical protein